MLWKYISKLNVIVLSLSKRLTVKGQISEEGGQQVHQEHGQEGHVGNALHLSAGTAVWTGEQGVFGSEYGLCGNMRKSPQVALVCSSGDDNEKKASVHSLFELLVHGQDGRVAHKGEGQDGNGVDGLQKKTTNSK